MDKNTKNIIEAGVTPEEFRHFMGRKYDMEDYLDMWPEQDERYYHLYELAKLRGLDDLAEFYKERSAPPAEYFLIGEQ